MDETSRPSRKRSAPKSRVISQLEYYKTQPDPKYGDSFQKVKEQFPILLKSLGLPSEPADIRAAVILSRADMDINARNLDLAKELDSKVNSLINSLRPKIAASLLESGLNPLETPIESIQEYIDSFNSKYDKSDSSDIFSAVRAAKPEIRPAIVSLYKTFGIITQNDSAALGYALKIGKTETLGDLLSIAAGFTERVSYAVDDKTPIKESIIHERSIRAEIKRACEYSQKLLTS